MPLRKAQNAIARARKDVALRRGKLKLKEPDKTNVVAALERQELRAWVHGLSQADRDKIFNGGGERVDPAIVEAVLFAAPELSGVAPSHLNLMRQRLLEIQFPGESADLADIEQAIALTERSVQVSVDEIAKEIGVPTQQLWKMAEPVIREVDAAEPALQLDAPEAVSDSTELAKQIKSLPYEARSKLIDLALDTNADHLIGNSALLRGNGA
jgi:hypothetical protein